LANGIPFTLTKLDPKSADFLNDLKRDIFLSLKCHDLGTIQEVDFGKQTVTVSINYKKTLIEAQKDGSYAQRPKEYPLLLDVPFVSLTGGQAGITLPIKKGDTCLVFYNDRAIDDWFASGAVTQVSSTRLHSMSDGIALVGVRSLANLIEGYDPERAVLYSGQTKVAVGTKVEISNQSQNLHQVLQDLISKISDLTTQVAAIQVTGVQSGPPSSLSGLPTNASAISGIIPELTAISSRLGEVLE